MPESVHNNDPCADSWADDGTPESPHDDEPGAADDTHESARHDESCANSCADHDTPESAHEDDPGADDDTHESKHDDDSCPMDPAPVMAEPVPHFAEDFQDFQQ